MLLRFDKLSDQLVTFHSTPCSREQSASFCARARVRSGCRERKGRLCAQDGTPSRGRERKGRFHARDGVRSGCREWKGRLHARDRPPSGHRERKGLLHARDGIPSGLRQRFPPKVSPTSSYHSIPYSPATFPPDNVAESLREYVCERKGRFCARTRVRSRGRERKGRLCARDRIPKRT